MASLFGTLKNDASKILTPIVNKVKALTAPSPIVPTVSPPLSTYRTPVPVTPVADALRAKFSIPNTPTPISTPSFSVLADQRANAINANVSPFIKNVFGAGGDILRAASTKADSFVHTNEQNFHDFVTGKLALHPDDIASGIKKTGVGSIKLTQTLVQGFNEGIARIAKSASVAALGEGNTEKIGKFIPDGLARDITGDMNPNADTYQKVASASDLWALDKGASRNGARVFAGFAVLGTLFMDNPITGIEAKSVFNLSKSGLKELAEESTEDGVKAILKRENPQLTPEAVEFMTPLYRDATTPEEVKQVTKFVQASQKTAIQAAEKKGIIEEGKKAAPEIPEELAPLAEEAKKYKNADEFADSIEYHGLSSGGKDEILKTGFRDANEGVFVGKADEASDYGETLPVLVKQEAKKTGSLERSIDDQVPISGTSYRASDVIPLPDSFKDRQAAIDFYTQSTKTTETVKPTVARAAPVDINLVKTLGAAKNPYEILNVLKNEFPNLPDRVVDRMVDRFVRTKRIETIEGLVRSGRDLNARFKTGELISAGKATLESGEKTLPKSAKEVIEKSVNPTVRKIMRQDQKMKLITTIKNRFEKPEEAVAAAQEYDRIWDDVNQQIVEQYENLSLQKSFLEDALSDEGAATLFKKYYRGTKADVEDLTTSLRDLMDTAHNKAKKIGKRGGKPQLTKAEKSARTLDAEIHEMGYSDFDEAQAAIQRYASMRKEVKDLGEQLKELKPRVREARILQEGLSDIAIVPREHVRAVDNVANAANFRDYFKDISGFSGQARDIYRNFEKFFGDKYGEIKKAILDPFDEAKGRFVDENKQLADSLDDEVVKKFGIRRGSKESAAIQRYGDTDLPEGERRSYEQLSEEFGKNKADSIVAADKYFRAQYDRLIDELNVIRKKIYPNTPGKLIAKRANYYRHFTEMSETWGDALREFFDTPSGIDPKLAGLSEFTKAKSRFLPFAEQRTGQGTKLDAVGGFIDYIPAFAYAKEIDPQISTFRYLRSKLAEVAPKVGEELTLPDGKKFKSKGAEAMLGFLDDFTRDLTGNTNPMDRWVQRVVGRRNIRAARFVNNRMKANSVTTFGAAIAQPFNMAAGIADTKLYAVPGLKRSFGGLVAHNEPMSKSIFIKERFATSLGERFPFQFKDRPLKATGDLAKKQVGWVLRTMDEVGTKFIWNSEYEKGLALAKKGKIDDAIKFADARTRKLVAGRGIGEVPLGQKALTTQFLAPFTLEVGNAWWVMKDWVKEKDAAALLTFFVANYAMNEIAERVRGSRVAVDPINSLIEGSIALSQEWKEGNYARGGVRFLGRQAGEVLANIPFGQQLAAITPDSGVQAATKNLTGAPMDKQQIFGNANVSGRFGTPLIVSGLQDAVYRLLPPVGGIQLKKSYQGLLALVKGQAEDSKGSPTFKIPRSPQNVVRALLFGANATSESRKYFTDRNDLFSRIDRQTADTFVKNSAAEKDWADVKKMIQNGDRAGAKAKLQSIAAENKDEAKAVMEVAKSEKAGLNPNDRLVKMLNVQNGERAKYISEQLKKMKTSAERKAYLSDLASKKILTKDVAKQMALLYKK